MAKRSPILGYNHNVRYRGLVFHVQTEDSGVLSPHLFTHLFFGGVIVSTRKLVYDAGANEEAIKALMQAQHKAVMKDLKKGSFDDKIDQYLAGTEGLEPRADGGKPARASTELDPGPPAAAAEHEAAAPEAPAPEDSQVPAMELAPEPTMPSRALVVEPSGPVPVIENAPFDTLLTQKTRTQTAERVSAPVRVAPPPPPEDEAPTISGNAAAAVAAAVQAANASIAPVHITVRTPSTPLAGRTPTPPSVPNPAATARPAAPPPPHRSLPQDFRIDSSPEIEISIDEEGRSRMPRDTLQQEPTVPTRADPPPATGRRHSTSDRPPSHVGATLPPAPRPPSRPSFTPPQVVARPVATPDGRARDSDAVEVHAPAPPSADVPPGERPGQYSMGRKNPAEPASRREPTGKMPKLNPSGPARPQPPPDPPQAGRPPPTPPARPAAAAAKADPSAPRPGAAARAPNATMPMTNRPAPAGGVVMTRPAVVVGAPPKAPAQQRIRKAREDEGRGFGQGLISEKSLDEVILAYLSEDAEEK